MWIHFKCQESSHQHHLFLNISLTGLLPPPANSYRECVFQSSPPKPLSPRPSPEWPSAAALRPGPCLLPLSRLLVAGANSALQDATASGPGNVPPGLCSVGPSGKLPDSTGGSEGSGKLRDEKNRQLLKHPPSTTLPVALSSLPAFSGFMSLSVCRQKMFIFRDWMRLSRWHIRFTRNSQFFHKISVFPEQATSLWTALVMFWFSGASKHFGVSS